MQKPAQVRFNDSIGLISVKHERNPLAIIGKFSSNLDRLKSDMMLSSTPDVMLLILALTYTALVVTIGLMLRS